MDPARKRFVKVRVNASGKRLIGIVAIPPPHFRISDYLNSHQDFLRVRQEKLDLFIAKETISYLEALEEGSDSGSRPRSGSFRKVTVSLRSHAGTLRGEVFISEGADLASSLQKARRFINVRDVRFVDSPERYDFLALGKAEIVMVQEDHEGR